MLKYDLNFIYISTYQNVKNEVATRMVEACGRTGVLNALDNNKLQGDVKVRHQNALKEANKHMDKNGNVDPHVQAIFARMYGLI